ncbi:MAG TPA: SUMF1/EgtB/PvdO family nonheme iron enzyme [Terriglobia bacterium]|nr:SUMF1/EgtB/PvdO family nonheme iron enzyme [Terriglobia bacterium]
MTTSRTWLMLALSFLLIRPLHAQDTHYAPEGEQIPGPANPSAADSQCCAQQGQVPVSEGAFQAWLEDIRHWRRERLIRIGYDGSQYERPELRWTQFSFVQPQMMAQDRYFYDPEAGHYTVERYLEDLETRYGGIDSVLIWPTYPNLGIDSRNQFDLIRDLPGGVQGLRAMVQAFHRHGVRVLFPYNPWDQGTRPEGAPDWEVLARLMAEIGADGVNGDTMDSVPFAFRAASDANGHPLALEPEGGATGNADAAVAWNTLTWGYWKYPFEPMISRSKWLEPRHLVNVCDRWARDKTDDLQYAFFNGAGYESWENIWGIWNGIDDRDAEAVRRIALIERRYAGLLVSPGWEPHTPMLQYGAFASRFPGARRTLWTVVNRNEYALSGRQIRSAAAPGLHYYDLWHGVEIQAEVQGPDVILSFDLEPHGYGAILATSALHAGDAEFLAHLRELARRPLAGFPNEWHGLPQRPVQIAATTPASDAPAGMIKIPAGDFDFEVSGIEIEGGNQRGVDVQMPWEDSPRRDHLRPMRISAFYIDRYPATNGEFKRFLDATHYRPRDDHNFLRDWLHGTFPAGWARKPVTWVSLEDARAYAAWAGKRLPHEWEWQYAAQGGDGRLYPWGNEWSTDAVPSPEKGRELHGPPDVGAHPQGASPFGVMDLVGDVWQWTDEYRDEHTRAAILRGGSYYQPQGSLWYFPQAYKLNEHGKYLLMAPGTDRSATVGFRCVVDAP